MKTITLPTRDAWVAERMNGLGASEVATALGVNPYSSSFALWALKTGMLPAEDLAREKEAVLWGTLLEPTIVGEFGRRTEREVSAHDQCQMIVHENLDFLRATLDARQWKPGREDPGDLQVKTAGARMSAEWADEIPLHIQIQVQAELSVTGMEWGTVACLLAGQKLLWYDFERDDAFIDAMLPHLEKFWHHVETKTPPPVDASPVTAKILARLHPDDSGQTIELPSEAIEWHEELSRVKEKIKALEEIKALHENQLKAAIGEHSFGQLSNGLVYSWKTQERAEHVVKASKYRVLRSLKG